MELVTMEHSGGGGRGGSIRSYVASVARTRRLASAARADASKRTNKELYNAAVENAVYVAPAAREELMKRMMTLALNRLSTVDGEGEMAIEKRVIMAVYFFTSVLDEYHPLDVDGKRRNKWHKRAWYGRYRTYAGATKMLQELIVWRDCNPSQCTILPADDTEAAWQVSAQANCTNMLAW